MIKDEEIQQMKKEGIEKIDKDIDSYRIGFDLGIYDYNEYIELLEMSLERKRYLEDEFEYIMKMGGGNDNDQR